MGFLKRKKKMGRLGIEGRIDSRGGVSGLTPPPKMRIGFGPGDESMRSVLPRICLNAAIATTAIGTAFLTSGCAAPRPEESLSNNKNQYCS